MTRWPGPSIYADAVIALGRAPYCLFAVRLGSFTLGLIVVCRLMEPSVRGTAGYGSSVVWVDGA